MSFGRVQLGEFFHHVQRRVRHREIVIVPDTPANSPILSRADLGKRNAGNPAEGKKEPIETVTVDGDDAGFPAPSDSDTVNVSAPPDSGLEVEFSTTSVDETAELLNINRSTVFHAKTVLKHGTPEEIEAAGTGGAGVRDGY